jgi:8-oxo-dGTP pyrophosphatase MutT (NUDIX family)
MPAKPLPEALSAGGIVFDDEGRILFCHPTGSAWTNWRMPKGLIDSDENARTAALREVLEETGYKCRIVRRLKTEPLYPSSRDGKRVMKRLKMYLMMAGKKVREPDWEHNKFIWVPQEKIEKYAANREREVILEALALWLELKQAGKV